MSKKSRVKICGMTNLADAVYSARSGADFLGFIFYNKSPRFIPVNKALRIIKNIPSKVKIVGVFVNASLEFVLFSIKYLGLKYVQLHGDESPAYCKELKKAKVKVIKAFRIKDKTSIKKLKRYKSAIDYFLLDTYQKGKPGGTGQVFDWKLAIEAKKLKIPVFLSGGINPDNVSQAIKEVQPFAVDVSSGVEKKPGQKNHRLIKELFTQTQ